MGAMQIGSRTLATPGLDFAAWIASNPVAASIAIDRELVRQGGLRAFIKLAWHTVEGMTPYSSNWHIDAICDHLEAVSRGEIKRCIIAVPPRSMKALDVDTPVLTTWGWKRHGDLRSGDYVFGPDGRPKRVLAVTGHHLEAAFDVAFDDGARLIAGKGHLWAVDRDLPYGGPGSTRIRKPAVVTTEELIPSVVGRSQQRPDRIDITRPVELPPRRLLIEPYTLGIWLGDGSTNTGALHASEEDIEHFKQHGQIGSTFPVVEGGTRTQAFYRLNIPGLTTKLRVLGLLGNKHIPLDYLEASVEQRWELLRGLLDTDGHATKTGWCMYVTKLPVLGEQVVQLACSLGIKAHHRETWSVLKGQRFGPYQEIRFTPPSGAKLFNLPRKQDRVRGPQNVRSTKRYVAAVTPVGERTVNCITVEGSLYLAGTRFVVTHNSVSTAVMWPAWDWIDNAQRRSLFASYAHNLSKRDSARCRRVIQSPWYQARFGERFKMTGDQNAKWRFENDKTGYRLATSVNGQLTGEGGDFAIIDDPLNSRDANSITKRENMLSWWSESMSTRLNDPANGAFVVIQQRLHEEDLIGDILKRHGVIEDGGEYHYLCLPALFEPDHPNRWFRDPRKEAGELLWPSHVPQKVIDTLRLALGEFGFAGQLQQRPAPREGGLFKKSWFPLVLVMPPDIEWARGWDMAATEKQMIKSDPDWTATVLIGWSRSMRRWYIADVRRWQESPAMVERMVLQIAKEDRDLGRDVKLVLPQDPGAAGKAMAQSYLQMLAGYDVELEAQSGDKGHRATPLASQASGGNISILKADWNEDFLTELCGFPTASHDDQVDAAASAFTRLTGGTTGLLEYYARQMDDLSRKKAQEALELAKNGGVMPGLVTRTEETEDFARALLATGTGKPVFS